MISFLSGLGSIVLLLVAVGGMMAMYVWVLLNTIGCGTGATVSCAVSTVEEVTGDEWCYACFETSDIEVVMFRWVEVEA